MDSTIRDQLRATLVGEIAPAFRVEVPLAQQRQVLDGMGAAAVLPDGLEVISEELAGLTCERLLSPGCSPDHALLYLHGGGYVMGSCASHRGLASRTALACGIQGYLPEYRLAPEHPYPAAVDDAVAAYRALVAGGLAPGRIVLAGDSAGGGLTLATLLRLRDEGDALPAAAITLSPYADLTFSGASIRERADVDPWLAPSLLQPFCDLYRGGADPAGPGLSPLFGDMRGLPPLLIHVGDQEILLSDALRVGERARAAGVEVELEVWPEVWHVFQLFAPLLPDANAALEKIGAFARRHLGLDERAS